MSEINPYQAPEANLEADSVSGSEGIGEPKRVEFVNGGLWIAEAFQLFMRNPIVWIINTILYLLISIVIGVIPLVSIILNVLYPILLGGLVLGSQAQFDGKNLTIEHLFAGFSKNTGQLALIGVLYLAVFILLFLLGIVVFGIFAGGFGLFDSISSPSPDIEFIAVIVLIGLAIMVAMIPVLMAYFFAPTLVVLHDFSAIDAMKASFQACWRNILPFFFYSVLVFVLFFLAAIPLFLGYLVLLPVLFITMFTAYRDIFQTESA